MPQVPDYVIDEAIAHYENQRQRALEMIDSIENRGWQYFEAHGNEPMHEVTDQQLARHRETAAQMDRLIAAYERLRAG